MINRVLFILKDAFLRKAHPLDLFKTLGLSTVCLWFFGMLIGMLSAALKMPEFYVIIVIVPVIIPLLLLAYLTPILVFLNIKNATSKIQFLLIAVGGVAWTLFLALITLLFSMGVTV